MVVIIISKYGDYNELWSCRRDRVTATLGLRDPPLIWGMEWRARESES